MNTRWERIKLTLQDILRGVVTLGGQYAVADYMDRRGHRLLIVGGVLLTAVALYLANVYWDDKRRLDTSYANATVWGDQDPVTRDSASLANGARLATLGGCRDCHGKNWEGSVIIDDATGYVVAPNLTPHPNSPVAHFHEPDWVKAIKHGIGTNNRPLWAMPSGDYSQFTPPQLADLIAYLETVPMVDKTWPQSYLRPLGYWQLYTNSFKKPFLDAENIDQTADEDAVAEAPTAAYGAIVVSLCKGCHGTNLQGGTGPNISGHGPVGGWTLKQFETALRQGKTPTGHTLDNSKMPWKNFASFSDTEIQALYAYLKTI